MKIKLSENQFNKIAPSYQRINELNIEKAYLNKVIEDLASIIFESNDIELKENQKFKIDFKAKELIIDEEA